MYVQIIVNSCISLRNLIVNNLRNTITQQVELSIVAVVGQKQRKKAESSPIQPFLSVAT